MKKFFKLFMACVMMFVMFGASTALTFASVANINGLGTKTSPYIITDADQLAAIAKKDLPLSAYYILDKDISLPVVSWIPIGANDTNGFTGEFDGNGHKITNLNIGPTTNSYSSLGLFALNTGTIKNLTVETRTIIATDKNVGIIAGSNTGTIQNCTVSGTISASFTLSGNKGAGGVTGYNNGGTIANCQSSYTLDCLSSDKYGAVGGIVGYINNSNTTISNCTFSGSLKNIKADYAGGIAGYSIADVKNCVNSGSIEGSANYVGGIAGCSDGSILDSKSTGVIKNITNTNYTGGIVGQAKKNISNCLNTGAINGVSRWMGGITGCAEGVTISGCFNKANIENSYALSISNRSDCGYTGGLIGENYSTVTDCYSIGNIKSGEGYSNDYPNYAGGFIGKNSSYKKYVTNCYCVGTVSNGQNINAYPFSNRNDYYYACCYDSSVNTGDSSSTSGIQGFSTLEMKDKSNYLYWDFDSTWNISSALNEGYPYLSSLAENLTQITLSDTEIQLINGNSKKLTATIYPNSASDKNIVWSSSDDNVASVNNDGNVTATGVGSAVVTATFDRNLTASCKVTVIAEDTIDDLVTFEIKDVSTLPGKRISVPIEITKNSAGICTMGVDISYDSSILTPVIEEFEAGDLFPDATCGKYSNVIRISNSSSSNIKGTGVVCRLKFDVAENISPTSVNLSIKVDELKTLVGNKQNDLEHITLHDGKVIIENYKLGDVNDDGKISASDATEVLLYWIDSKDFSLREKMAGDVNKDGEVSTFDAALILKAYVNNEDFDFE